MARQIIIGLMAEGSTDLRFLKSIIERTFTEIAFECAQEIDIYGVVEITVSTGLKFVEKILEASSKSFEVGATILCVHADADGKNLQSTYADKIHPATEALNAVNANAYCKILVAIVPIQEIEAWMLADKELLKEEIGTKMTDQNLGINRLPEQTSQPKEIIEEAIRKARAALTKKRRNNLTIADLYLPIGQNIDLEKLDMLSSYQDFKENIRNAFRTLKLLK